MIRPISLGTRLGFGLPVGAGVEADVAVTPAPAVPVAEPGAGFSVRGIGPVTVSEVSDIAAVWASVVAATVEVALLLFAAEAELALPLQAVTATTKETRTDLYIFPRL